MIHEINFQNIFLVLVVSIGSVYDIKTRKIPNWLNFGTVLIVILFGLISFKMDIVLNALIGFFVGILLLLIPYLTGTMGAGDVKLLGALGAIVGFKNIILIFLYTAVSGGVVGIIWLMFNPERLKFLITTGQVLPAIDKKQKLPYGTVIFLGTFIYIILGDKYISDLPIWQLIQHL